MEKVSEQPGNRIPSVPKSSAWESQDPSSGGDPESGKMGSDWRSGGEGGGKDWVSHPNPGGTFSGSK